LLARQKVVGWVQGRMEFGPRALGNRSILGDPRNPEMQKTINLKIKFRESFRPFAPAVLHDRASGYFQMDDGEESPYMLMVAPVLEKHRVGQPGFGGHGLDERKTVRSVIPAVTHVDCTARVQTVDAGRNARFHRLLESFEAQTGCPMLINTSFNVRGEPLVCTPEHAYRCFMATDMDVLVMENCVLLKEQQAAGEDHHKNDYLAHFELD
jgi:carbamoyltransferase